MLSREGQNKNFSFLKHRPKSLSAVAQPVGTRLRAADKHGLRKVGQQTGAFTQILRRGTCDGIQAQLSVNVC